MGRKRKDTMLITIDSHELGLTDLQAQMIMQTYDKRGALRRELAYTPTASEQLPLPVQDARTALKSAQQRFVEERERKRLPLASLR